MEDYHRKMKYRAFVLLKISIALAGGFLCARLLADVGWAPIREVFQQHGSAVIILISTYVIFHLVRTWTLAICIPVSTRFWELFGIRLAGEAIAYVAVGSILGDAAKVAVGRHRIPVVEGATGVFAEKIIYHLAGAGFIIGGLMIAVVRFGLSTLLFYGIA